MRPEDRTRLSSDAALLQTFCEKWRIRELSLFGSVIRSDYSSTSDIDVLVEFEDGAGWSLFDLIDISDELKRELGREVHLVEKEGLRNPYRRREILNHREILYVA
jgi:predicted nucleotidyltransferase